MDTSEKYIKMCERAQEIQEYYQNEHTVDVMLRDFVFVKSINFYDSVCVKFDKTRGFWLPRQDQLQEMCNCEKYGFTNSPQLDNDGKEMKYRVVNLFSHQPFVVSGDSWEQLLLSFIMKEKYNKIWNEEKQEWNVKN